MRPVLGRLFLFTLLVIDWWADPSLVAPALEASAAPLASTTCFCHSVVHRETIRQVLTSTPQPALDCAALPCGEAESFAPVRQAPTPTFRDTDLLYVFLSIRC
jgi:hypothetical protein